MLELSQQHDAEKSAASQRLRAMASKREDLERQLSQQQAVIGELQTEIRCMCDRYTESEERQLMAFEDCASDVPRLIEKRDEIHVSTVVFVRDDTKQPPCYVLQQSLVVKFRHQWQQEMQQAIDELQRCSDNEKTMMAEEALVRQCVVLQSQQENHQVSTFCRL